MLSVLRAARALPQITAVEVASPESLDLVFNAVRPDTVLAFGGEELDEEWLSRRRGTVTTWVLWTTEDPFELALNTRRAWLFDWVFTSDRGSCDAYAHPRCRYLPLAGDPALAWRPVREDPGELWYDLLFVGTAWPNRVAFLEELSRIWPSREMRSRFLLVSSPHIPPVAPAALGRLPFERDVRVSPADLATLQNRSRYVLTLDRDFSGRGDHGRQSTPTNRVFEAALAGSGQILAAEGMSLDALGPAAASVRRCHRPEDVVGVVREGIRQPERRNREARSLQDAVLADHGYPNRLVDMLRVVGAGG